MFEHFQLSDYYGKIIGTIILLILVYILRLIISKLVQKFTTYSVKTDNRSKLIIKYFNTFLNILFVIFLIIVWGVDYTNLFSFVGAAFTFIGVALFAQWSVLSNFTAGVIMFFAFPFKIGDRIRIQDKDFPIEAEIDDIKAFHTILITAEAERISYPNNLFLQKAVVIL
ncbi:mechanosensitive ion channel [Flavobacterium sp. xlx-214]|uniref:mechanosensitive ion channel domain-containing protein n=1 Tax=unclassified Flavobacterium TaxID=196869 RepID=UPI0013D761E6|nr:MULTISPECIES: mechanosensitive ion channel domain-containing protein [unclassified Flavobacterium]MBA5793548.1 mechanosensitive ion channel [Flavobacterium sp. xlx-221]QMI82683.1 mechanosensitive ion channel [Flavobacterium sp. xlx-214]